MKKERSCHKFPVSWGKFPKKKNKNCQFCQNERVLKILYFFNLSTNLAKYSYGWWPFEQTSHTHPPKDLNNGTEQSNEPVCPTFRP
jgi:hypothetical protein